MSYVIIEHLVLALREMVEFFPGDHAIFMGEGKDDIHQRHSEDAEMALGESQAAAFTEGA